MPTSVSVTNLSDGRSASLTILPRTVERCAAPKNTAKRSRRGALRKYRRRVKLLAARGKKET